MVFMRNFVIQYVNHMIQVPNTSVALTEGNSIPIEMKKGEAKLMVVEAFITAPMAELTFTVGQPLGYTVNITYGLFLKDMK